MDKEIIIETKSNQIVTNNIAKYFNKPGIWALFGRKKNEEDWVCLNVGKNKNIGREILYDLGCLFFVPFLTEGVEEYISYSKKQCGFKYNSGLVQEYLYSYIAKEYYELQFIYVNKDADLDYEREFAKKNKALFWRHGRPFKNESKSNEEIGETKMDETKLKTILEQMTDSKGRKFVKDKKDVFLSNYSMWHRDEGEQLIEKFVRIVKSGRDENFSWLDILKHSNIEGEFEVFNSILKNKERNINMHYQIPEQFHGDIDNALLFHCMENPKGYVKDTDMDKWAKTKSSPTIVDYYIESEKKRTGSQENELPKILEQRHKYVEETENLEEFIKDIIYSDESELERELNHMFDLEEDFDFTENYVLKLNKNSQRKVLGYYYLASYYYQLLQRDKFDLCKYNIEIDNANEKNREKSLKIAKSICNIEAYPFSCWNPKLGEKGIGRKIIMNSDISHFGVFVVLRRIYRYLSEKGESKKPIFIFRKYKGVWEPLFNKIKGCEEIIDYLEENFFYCQLSQQGGGITSNNVCSIAKYKKFEKESAFSEIVELFSDYRI